MPRPSPMCAAAIAAAFVLLSAGCQQTKLGATWQSEEFGQGNCCCRWFQVTPRTGLT